MLYSTFQHIPGIGKGRERSLWRAGIVTWDDYDARSPQLTLRMDVHDQNSESLLAESRRALESGDVRFFAQRLPHREHYRIALAFPAESIFLDIETTGLSRYYDKITVVGWSLGGENGAFVRGTSANGLIEAMAKAKAIVTFNGSLFDLPFLRRDYPDLRIPPAHVDLRFLARRVGLSGSQKFVEKHLGIRRLGELENLEGRDAPLLWFRFCHGDRQALKLLMEYNLADVEGMKRLTDAIVVKLVRTEGIPQPIWPRERFSSARRGKVVGRRVQAPLRSQSQPWNSAPLETAPVRIADLIDSCRPRVLRVVGIDLTASEARPSGWCFLEGDSATTLRVRSDDELCSHTFRARPDLVSIDSPLSLPKGRRRATDDDPTRDLAGITRMCERVLRGRGISVYPCLIPSMQKLTQRGMRLATTLRAVGIPVIESYPGAAQDILGIPRKRASLDLLTKGLSDFGVRGRWQSGSPTHDELDAITAALVGLFFWSGRFEALGDPEEGGLVVPELRQEPNAQWNQRVLGLSGPIAAGKTTAGMRLRTLGYRYGRFSEVLANLLREDGKAVGRKELQRIGQSVHRHCGQRWLCQRLVKEFEGLTEIVVDGMRYPEDHAFLVEKYGPGFAHIHISAPPLVRRERYRLLGFSDREFRIASTHPVEEAVEELSTLSHSVIVNDRNLADFYDSIDGLMRGC